MAELLVKAVSHTHPDPEKDQRGAYKRGMPVVVKPDGWPWGAKEGLPNFVLIKVPGISVERVEKYTMPELDESNERFRRRQWRIRWEDLPNQARQSLLDNGELVIAAGGYAGPYDYTWQQVRGYFRNLKTGQDETEDL